MVDVSKASRGIITLKWQNEVTEAMTQNVRRHLHFWVGLSAELRKPFHATRVWDVIAALPEQLAPNVLRQLGQKMAGRAQR